MSIRPSSSDDVARLVAELLSGESLRQQMALARLAIIGTRATTPLLDVATATSQPTAARVAAFEALEAIGDARILPPVLTAVVDPHDDVAIAAIGALGAVARGTSPRAAKAFDRLAALATATEAPVARRLAALAALDGQPDELLAPLLEALADDPASGVVARVTRRQSGVVESLDTLIEQGLTLPPDVIAAVVRDEGDRVSLAILKRAVDALRAREATSAPEVKAQWSAVRGLLHQHLAARQSRLAVYDLRETLEEATGPLPVGFVSAAAAIGDATCLTAVAKSWAESPTDDRWWRAHLAEAFGSIVSREKVTRRHPTLKHILEQWPSAGVLVAMARK